jgi:hypothetical protein
MASLKPCSAIRPTSAMTMLMAAATPSWVGVSRRARIRNSKKLRPLLLQFCSMAQNKPLKARRLISSLNNRPLPGAGLASRGANIPVANHLRRHDDEDSRKGAEFDARDAASARRER